ncbi:hypothetical protein LINGRAHAP2_LOCUS20459 [Linum grandiflorum]
MGIVYLLVFIRFLLVILLCLIVFTHFV